MGTTESSTSSGTTVAASTPGTNAAGQVTLGGECWSSTNGVASGGCAPGTQCGPWLPDGGSWDGSSAWYCLAVPKLASGASCDYSDSIKRGLCDTGMACCNNVCATSCATTTTTTTTTSTTTTTEACANAGAQCLDYSTFQPIAVCCTGLTCIPPGNCS